MNEQIFISKLKEQGIELSVRQTQQFVCYYQLLVEWNEKINLTTITDKDAVYEKHFYDSLSLSFYHQLDKQTICDVGAGAGFPSLPLKIVYPQLKVTIVDSLNKRIVFLQELVKKLELEDVILICDRAEDYAKVARESFDIVTARAVARLSVLSELCLPLVKKEGYFIALKGKQGEEELVEAVKGIKLLGGEVVAKEEFNLHEEEKRMNLYIKKIKTTPEQYPRQYSRIKKKPL